MKRFLLLYLVALLPIVSLAENAQRFKVAPFAFEIIDDNSVALIEYNYNKEPNPMSTELVIPEQVTFENRCYKVTAIEGGSRIDKLSCFLYNKRIKSIIIPNCLPCEALMCSLP